MPHPPPRVGVEIELMAPRGHTRRDLAERLADGGRVEVFLHPDSEPSRVPGTPVFANLTLGFRALDAQGQHVASLVDDLTLQAGLDRSAAPLPGWWRVVSDERRLLHLVRRHGRADAGPREALAPVAELFGVQLDTHESGLIKVCDPDGMPVAMGAALPSERWRPCEIVTPPLQCESYEALEATLEKRLAPAREMGFRIPEEAAVHVHFDAGPMRHAPTFARTVRWLFAEGESLRQRFSTNPRCRRLGSQPAKLLELVNAPDFAGLSWPQAAERLRPLQLQKYRDFNLRNVVYEVPDKPTFEVRILPGSDHGAQIATWVRELDGLLRPLGALG